MSFIGIDIGSTTTKIIEYSNEKITNKKILEKIYEEKDLQNFLRENNINNVEKIFFTGSGSEKVEKNNYDVPIEKIDEFKAIGIGGSRLGKKNKAIIVSVGTGTALIEINNGKIKHLGGTGVGAGTLLSFCNRFLNINSFGEIVELVQKGNLDKIDLRIGDVIEEEIATLPRDLTLANFGKFENTAKKEDIVLGFVNMIFEVIGMMAAFASINSDIKDTIIIGNITSIPGIENIFRKIEYTHKIKFTIPKNSEYAVALGSILSQNWNSI